MMKPKIWFQSRIKHEKKPKTDSKEEINLKKWRMRKNGTKQKETK